jgi:hypothetical protein
MHQVSGDLCWTLGLLHLGKAYRNHIPASRQEPPWVSVPGWWAQTIWAAPDAGTNSSP